MPDARYGTPDRSAPEISIVIPAHNEALRIGQTLHNYANYFGARAELIVVLNGCTDNTLEVVESLKNSLAAPLRVLSFSSSIGKKGGAIIEGFKAATGAKIGFVDADNATTPEEFDRLCGLLGANGMVFGSRWMPGATVYNRTSFLRKLASKSFVILVRVLFGLPFHDTQCGVKLFTRKALHRILPHISTTDSAIDVELLLVARREGLSILEEPTVWTDNDTSVYSTSPFKFYRTSFSMLRSLIRLRLKSYSTKSYEE